jgi:hypothetical protein
MRSIIIHGRWENDPEIDDVMGTTEGIVRTVFRRLLENPEMRREWRRWKRWPDSREDEYD